MESMASDKKEYDELTASKVKALVDGHLRHRSPENSGQMEDVVLEKLERFLRLMENRMESFEEYGVAVLDKSIENAWALMLQLRTTVVKAPKERAEAFVRLVERNCQEQVQQRKATVNQRISNGVKYCEDLLHKVETSYAADAVQRAVQTARKGLLTRDQLPEAWQDNPYIIRGYRFCQTPYECLTSALRLHNETTNIWTHLGGFFIVLGLAFFHLPSTEAWKAMPWSDRLPMMLFIVAALKCLVCSVTWHTFCNIAHLHTKQRASCVDYTGIVTLITASIVTTIYSALYCHPVARNVYMTLTGLFGAGGLYFTWSPAFDTPEARLTRVIFFVSFALSGVVAAVHAMIFQGFGTVAAFYAPVIKSLASYAIGIIFYAFLIPERWLPGSIFDYVGMSHNLWHICVFGGIYYHYQATVLLFAQARQFTCAVGS